MVQFLQKYGFFYWIGIKYTLILSVLSLFFGFFLGTLLALTRLSKHKVLSYLATAYIEFFRGTPLMVQLYMVYFDSFEEADEDVEQTDARLRDSGAVDGQEESRQARQER